MNATDVQTNRDLYLFIAALQERREPSKLELQSYLRAIWHIAKPWAGEPGIPTAKFAQLLDDAFEVEPPPFDPDSDEKHRDPEPEEGFAAWERLIIKQIVDLQQMEHAGMLKNEERYFGVDAPSGSRWFNFDPLGFLECAAAGSLGGWQSGDNTGREYVPGPVAVLDGQGQITEADPRDLESPILPLAMITWAQFADFLYCGQVYE